MGYRSRNPTSVQLPTCVIHQDTCAFHISRKAEFSQFTILALHSALDFPIHTKSQRKLSQSG